MILSVSEYSGIPRILFQRGILYVESWDDTECVRVSQNSPDTFPRGTPYVESWGDTECVRVSWDSLHTFQRGYTECGILG